MRGIPPITICGSDSCIQTLGEATLSILEARGTILQGGAFQLMM